MDTVMGNFISTTSERLDTIEIKAGQLIFVSDKREIYLDINNDNVAKRVPYHSILNIEDEDARIALENPLQGFYYVIDSNKLWAYIEDQWIDITYKDDKEDVINKITVIDSSSTDVQYPSAKAVWTLCLTKEDKLNKTTTLSSTSTDTEYPSAKAVYDLVDTKEDKANKTTIIDNTSDNIHYPTAEAVYLGLNAKVNQVEKGAAHGVAELDENGIIIRNQLPSYVDDVLEFNSVSDFPAIGESGKIYVDTTTNLTYRWSGSDYIEISPSLALGETSATAYRGDRGAIAYAHAVTNKGNSYPNGLYKITTNSEGHVTSAVGVTKADITGLGIPGQDTIYTAGTNINIDDSNTISAVDTTYTAGTNVNISNNNVISAVDTKYTAGTGINISSNNVISNTQTSAEWGNITGTLSDQTDLNTALNSKQSTLVSGTNIKTINNQSLLGSGDITIGGGGGTDEIAISTTQPTGDEVLWINPEEASSISASVAFDSLPIGTIVEYSSPILPDGYLMCDGSAVSRTTYSDLFNKIGITYGSGDGSTTFNLPNLKGKVPVGLNSSDNSFNTLGKTGGEKTHTLTTTEIPSHSHILGETLLISNGGSSLTGSGSTPHLYSTAAKDAYSNVGSSGGGEAHNNLQPYIVVNYIIKAYNIMPTAAQIQDGYSTSTSDGYSCHYINDNLFSGSYNDLTNKPTIPSMDSSYGTSTTNGYTQQYINGIVESGSNSNGNWIKYIDGTMICTKKVSQSVAVTTAWGSMYEGGPVALGNFAQTFIDVPTVNITIQNSGTLGGIVELITGITTQSAGSTYVTRGTSNTTTYTFHITAIGRWK